MSSLIRSNDLIDRDDFGHDARGPLMRDFGGSDISSRDDDERLMEGWRDSGKGGKKSSGDFLRYLSFGCAMLSCLCAGSVTVYSLYGHLFLKRLHYTQFQVNIVSITAELSTYLLVPIFGYFCDRYSLRSLSLLAGLFFGLGYLLAAFTYRQGPPTSAGGNEWLFPMMALSFVGIGMGTSSMYISAVTTCAKNFGRGQHKGFALAMPIAAFGLSGMWQSQIRSRLLCERRADGGRRDVDVFRFFLFLGITLFVAGVVGAFGLRVVDEGELINEGVEELERSGLLSDSEFFRASGNVRDYGTLEGERRYSGGSEKRRREVDDARRREEEDQRKKI